MIHVADYYPAYNVATCRTLFELDAGQHPHLGVEPTRTLTVEAADTFTRRLDHAQEEAKATLKQAADDMKWYYDRNRQAVPEYKVGDRVWLSLQNYSSAHCKRANWELGLQNALHYSVSKGVIQRK